MQTRTKREMRAGVIVAIDLPVGSPHPRAMKTLTAFWTPVVEILQRTRCRCRVRLAPGSRVSGWIDYLFLPVPSYLEGGGICEPMRDVEWMEIESMERRRIGRLVPDRLIDRSAELIAHFEQHGTAFQRIEGGFKILPPPEFLSKKSEEESGAKRE